MRKIQTKQKRKMKQQLAKTARREEEYPDSKLYLCYTKRPKDIYIYIYKAIQNKLRVHYTADWYSKYTIGSANKKK